MLDPRGLDGAGARGRAAGLGAEGATAAVVSLALRSAPRGWVPATSGNFSARVDATTAMISASGLDKGALRAEHVLPLPLTGALPPRVSAEAPLHRALYRVLDGAGAIAHVHSLAATLASLEHVAAGAIHLEGLELLKAFAGVTTHEVAIDVPVVPNTQDMLALAAEVESGAVDVSRAPALLLAGHGAYVWGRDAEETWRHLEALDFLLTFVRARGGARP